MCTDLQQRVEVIRSSLKRRVYQFLQYLLCANMYMFAVMLLTVRLVVDGICVLRSLTSSHNSWKVHFPSLQDGTDTQYATLYV